MSVGAQFNSFGMDAKTLAQACHTEFNLLQSVRQALRKALRWDVANTGFTQKLCSVRFALKSLDRHLQRMMELEERGGYMAVVGDAKPYLRDKVEALQAEHDSLRGQFGDLMESFEALPGVVALSSGQQETFVKLCDDLDKMLFRLDQHEAKETALLQEVLLSDVGGEG
ncbi:MAG: hypothetical protein MI757_03180 [Pirellulales bacterium]|nr:hypothetical protein [Pirellulales bacterium]